MGAGASVNHLHFQGWYTPADLPLDMRPRQLWRLVKITEQVAGEGRHRDGERALQRNPNCAMGSKAAVCVAQAAEDAARRQRTGAYDLRFCHKGSTNGLYLYSSRIHTSQSVGGWGRVGRVGKEGGNVYLGLWGVRAA